MITTPALRSGLGAGGAWLTSTMRVGKRLGWLDESDAPTWDGMRIPDFPEALDLLAKPNRQQAYQRIRKAQELKSSISNGMPVMAVFEITAQ
jgi:hypothetical protein